MEFADKLRGVRIAKAMATLNLAVNERVFATAKAKTETDLILEAGGIKELGTNEAAQTRTLLVLLDDTPGYGPYKVALKMLDEAKQNYLLADAELNALLDSRRDFENMLNENMLKVSELELAGLGRKKLQ